MRKVLALIAASIAIAQSVLACPNCVGRITRESKPFFSDEFYKVEGKSLHHLYQALEQTSSDKQSFSTASNLDAEDAPNQSGEQ